ncbi:hypothetical protein QJS10_CPB15g01200 [Acorus calamus]|uniref:Endonuclease/exonuclease/phosphatase domain-containing protein n=1 Tax=Acorus calamus TaxID=4465 RepID=A0AAV9D5F3_ACOCL|nr:hypothetical protein QJS10_CPB15g01200 [Acorus calamus]
MEVTILDISAQVVHCKITLKSSTKSLKFSIIYGSNSENERALLWRNLLASDPGSSMPWLVGGDFNEVRFSDEKLGGRPPNIRRLHKFNSCLEECNLHELHTVGQSFSWSNKQASRIACCLDRIVANSAWFAMFPEAYVQYTPESLSDHAALKLHAVPPLHSCPKPFKFFDTWFEHNSFWVTLEQAWSIEVTGSTMFRLARKLQHLKQVLKSWNPLQFGNAQDRIRDARANLQSHQNALLHDHLNGAQIEADMSTLFALKKR